MQTACIGAYVRLPAGQASRTLDGRQGALATTPVIPSQHKETLRAHESGAQVSIVTSPSGQRAGSLARKDAIETDESLVQEGTHVTLVTLMLVMSPPTPAPPAPPAPPTPPEALPDPAAPPSPPGAPRLSTELQEEANHKTSIAAPRCRMRAKIIPLREAASHQFRRQKVMILKKRCSPLNFDGRC